IAFVWVEENSGNRSIAWNSGSKKALKSQDLNNDIIKNAQIIHLDGREGPAALEAIKIIKKNGGKVSLDGGAITPNIQQIVRYTDFLIVSEEFAKKFTGLDKKEQFLKKLKENNSIVTIVTCGKNGFYGYIGEQYIEKKAFPVKVVDTSGAGDVLHGAFIFAYLKNMSLEDSLIFANVAASLKCAKFGVRNAVPSYNEILDITNKCKNDL
ncbi:MAG: carbohydrate kinase family protein, partial [Candidatus Humimicrobiaceae bacterium]